MAQDTETRRIIQKVISEQFDRYAYSMNDQKEVMGFIQSLKDSVKEWRQETLLTRFFSRLPLFIFPLGVIVFTVFLVGRRIFSEPNIIETVVTAIADLLMVFLGLSLHQHRKDESALLRLIIMPDLLGVAIIKFKEDPEKLSEFIHRAWKEPGDMYSE